LGEVFSLELADEELPGRDLFPAEGVTYVLPRNSEAFSVL
jgi:hypothetical protein